MPAAPPIEHDSPGPSAIGPDELLQLYLDANYDLRALAREAAIPIIELLDWLESPQTQRALDRLRNAAADALALRAAESRRTAIDALERVLIRSEDPIEQRRAATALLRALNARTGATGGSTTSAITGATGGSSTSAIHQPAPTSQQTDESTPFPKTAPLPGDPRQVLYTALNALSERSGLDPDDGLTILHACCAPGATINGEPIAEDPADFIDDNPDLADHLSGHVQLIPDPPETTPTTHHEHVCIVHPHARCIAADFRLEPLTTPTSRAREEAVFTQNLNASPSAASPTGTPSPDATLASTSDATAESNQHQPWRITALTLAPIETGFP